METALITGITGQDGAYLSQFLIEKGYKVTGLVRSLSGGNLSRLDYLGIQSKIQFLECDLQDLSQVLNIIREVNPDEIYNLAAQSSVGLSFQQPIGTLQFNISSVLNQLEAIRLINPKIKFYQASSSEMFGNIEELPITETSKLHPVSPYAISKVAAHHITVNYRESYGLFACCGILFNHESYLRGKNFFVKKVIRGALDIKEGKIEELELGNLNIKRDFGWSKKYVEAMYAMMQQEQPGDFVISSGKSVWLYEIVEYVFKKLEIPYSKIVEDKSLLRPNEITDIYGSSEKARKVLGWNYKYSFYEVLDFIIEEEQQNYFDEN